MMHNRIPDKFRPSIRRVAFFFVSIFVILFIYLSYIQIYESSFLVSHPLNRRTTEASRMIEHGKIYDRHKERLAYSVTDGNGGYKRQYPYGIITSHVIGYDSTQYGKSGIEATYTGYLSGLSNPERRLGSITHLWDIKSGNNVILTLDAKLQEIAYTALGNNRGSVVAISPRTGEILVMVSKPGFDPNNIDRDWQNLSQSSVSPLLNRAVQGLYPPGSIIKTMVAETALSEKKVSLKDTFNCTGSLKIGSDYTLNESNHTAHGKIDLEEALAVSCNITFGTLSLQLGRDKMANMFEKYGFNKSINSDIQEVPNRIPNFKQMGEGDLAQTGIGQGSLLVTPLRMAMLASCFANNGTIMQPYMVKQITAPDETIIKSFNEQEFSSPVNSQIANQIQQMMITVVNNGTGSAARLSGISVAGKTGTAENPLGDPHAWFIGFAPADNPQIAIAVIVENGGSGGQTAAPIARKVFEQALR